MTSVVGRGRGSLRVNGGTCTTGRTRASLHTSMCILMSVRTNIDLDDDVLAEAQRLTGSGTKRETVDLALRELVARHRRLGILALRGRVHWSGDLEASREGRP